MPLGRNFGGGWVAMRSDWAPGATVLLFDAGQPFWRSRQHYDAGQFQIHRKGRLAIDAGDDVAFQATLDQGGRTLIGGEPGDWDEFAQATIAHNCITVVDQRFPQRQYGRSWPAIGNQRIIERNYAPAEGDIDKTPRRTGEVSAFETNSFYSYAGADVTAAYPTQTVLAMTRQILFVHAGAVFVLDRVESARPASIKTWHLQLPDRPVLIPRLAPATRAAPDSSFSLLKPAADMQHLRETGSTPAGAASAILPMGARQLHGRDESAGIWELGSEHAWLSVAHGDGRLFVCTLLPADAQRRLVGGPMHTRVIERGPMAGRTYVGGDPFGYEYRLWPAHFLKAPSASYQLGSPVGLGPQLGVGAAWGRCDVSATGAQANVTFLHVLIPTDASVSAPPPLRFDTGAQAARIEITLGDQTAVVLLTLDHAAGEVSIRNAHTGEVVFEKELKTQVEE